MTLEPSTRDDVFRALDSARALVDAARAAPDTEAMKEAIRVARLNLIHAYEALTEAEQALRAKYWKAA